MHCIVTLTFDVLNLTSIGHILKSWEVCVLSFMILCEDKATMQQKPFSIVTAALHCDIDLRARPPLRGVFVRTS